MLNGTNVQSVVTRLESFFKTEKGMDVQSSQTTDGYVMQASQPKDGWKTLTGMRLAVTVQMAVMENGLNVTVGGTVVRQDRRRCDRSVCRMAACDNRRDGGFQAEEASGGNFSGNRKLHHVGRSFHCRERCGTKVGEGMIVCPECKATDCRRIKILQSMRRQA